MRLPGWFSIERAIFTHPFFALEPVTEREAFFWLIAHAAWDDTTHKVMGKSVAVPRGTMVTTLRHLQHSWLWETDKRVRGYLRRLEKEGMIKIEVVGAKRASRTHITICNYSKYQAGGRKTEMDAIADANRDAKDDAPNPLKTTPKDTPPSDVDAKRDAITDAVKEQDKQTTTPQKTREPIKPSPFHRSRLLAAMGIPDDHMTASGFVYGNSREMLEVARWTNDLGLTDSEQVSIIQDVMVGWRKDEPPTTFRYFTGAMRDFAGLKNQQPLRAIEGGRGRSAKGSNDEHSSGQGGIHTNGPQHRADPALEQIARLARLGASQGDGRG